MRILKNVVVCLFLCASLCCILSLDGYSESQGPEIYVTATLLNGRAKPIKRSTVEAFFDRGDTLTPTGEWSKNHQWIEVVGGETGTVWVHIDYVSECHHYLAVNRDYRKVKVRKHPVDGKVTHYISRGETVEIEQVVLGWGKTKWGWVDLYFLEEV